MTSRDPMDRLRLAIGYGVLGTWLAAFVVSVAKPEFNVSPALQLLMTLIGGTVFAPTILGRDKHHQALDRDEAERMAREAREAHNGEETK